MRASIKEMLRVRSTMTETSAKKFPILPSRKKKVEKATIVVKMAEVMGGITSIVPSMAARMAEGRKTAPHPYPRLGACCRRSEGSAERKGQL